MSCWWFTWKFGSHVRTSKIQEKVKQNIEDNNQQYKKYVDQKRRQLQFQAGDLVMAHLHKERFPTRTYNKLKMKKIGPCQVLRKFSVNAYKISFPVDLNISPIFNVAYLYPYKGDVAEDGIETTIYSLGNQPATVSTPP
ncbi:hypothetical protein SUGI_0947790 [Cryptomeria japonica]|nr:hypothetical protein SUGI_0947790 [Cryptomeria japonica]